MRSFFAGVVCLLGCGGSTMKPMGQLPVTQPPMPMTQSQPPAPQYSCLQVLGCVVECAETDEACQNACLAKGTESAKTQTIELATCLDQNACADSDCASTKCGSPLSTCLGASVPPASSSSPPMTAPPGNVPASWVGTWSGARNGITTTLVLGADGTGSWWSSTTTLYAACSNVSRRVRTGTFVVDGNFLTMYATKVEEQIHDCIGPDQVTQLAPITEKAQFIPTSRPDELLFVDEACAAQYPEGRDCTMYAGCPIGLYCTARLTRE